MIEIGYTAAAEGAVFFKQTQMGMLSIRGEDRRDFLQRQTTYDMADLGKDNAPLNVLTSPTARIIEVFQMIERPDAIELVTLGRPGSNAYEFLKSKIFFMDKVEVIDRSHEVTIIDVEGPNGEEILSKIEADQKMEDEEWRETNLNGTRATVIKQGGLTGEFGYRLIVPKESEGKVTAQLEDLGMVELGEDAFEVIRVEAGSPLGGNELNEAYTPLEIGLMNAISDNKGCYTGQEVIARQISYDKITKRLARIEMDEGAEQGSEIRVDDKKIGVITSAVSSPRFGALALGVVKLPFDEPGTQLLIRHNEKLIKGRVQNALR